MYFLHRVRLRAIFSIHSVLDLCCWFFMSVLFFLCIPIIWRHRESLNEPPSLQRFWEKNRRKNEFFFSKNLILVVFDDTFFLMEGVEKMTWLLDRIETYLQSEILYFLTDRQIRRIVRREREICVFMLETDDALLRGEKLWQNWRFYDDESLQCKLCICWWSCWWSF